MPKCGRETPNLTHEINHQTGELTIMPMGGIVGEYSIYVGVRQADGTAWDTQLVPIVVTPDPDVPLFTPIGPQSTPENTTLHFQAHATDPDFPLTYALIGAPDGAEIDPATGEFSWTPTETDGPGDFTFQISATDTADDTGYVEVAIHVTEVNEAPVLHPIPLLSADEHETATFTATANDEDLPANTLTFSLGAGAPEGAVIDPRTGVFTWIPNEADGPGTFTFDVVVTDEGGRVG